MIVRVEARLMNIDEDEGCLEVVVQRVDGVDEMLARFLHELDERAFAGRQAFRKVWIPHALGDARKEPGYGGDCLEMRLYTRPPTLGLGAEIHIIIKDLRLLIDRQFPDIDHRAFVRKLRKVSLS